MLNKCLQPAGVFFENPLPYDICLTNKNVINSQNKEKKKKKKKKKKEK